MTTQTLYSLRTDGDQYRITKIVDGEIESSYIANTRECECPAGHRASCRHRQMIPDMLARGILDSMWFWDFDSHRVVDFNGELKSNLDALNELAAPRDEYLEGIMNRDAVGEAHPSEPKLTGLQEEQILMGFHNEPTEAEGPPSEVSAGHSLQRPWRRL